MHDTGKTPAGFSSVKLPAALVRDAREAAQPLRRSVAGQIEYWATLGRVAEHTGLTAQEALTAIEGYESAARAAQLNSTLDDMEARFATSEQGGTLAARVREIVSINRSKSQAVRKAA